MTTNAPTLGGTHAADQPLPRTAEEILAYIKEPRGMFDFTADVAVGFLPYSLAEEFLNDEYKAKVAAGEEEWKQHPLTRDFVIEQMRDYMEFAWGKVEDHRGLSAGRSVNKMTAWCWLLGDEETTDTHHAQYGAPILMAVCKKYGFPAPEGEWVARMAAGKRCRPDCDEGCGS